jgi:hypothetical protein
LMKPFILTPLVDLFDSPTLVEWAIDQERVNSCSK